MANAEETNVADSAGTYCSTVCEECDFCGQMKPVKFQNWVRAFCSAACVNGYLKNEGFAHRLCVNCEKENVLGGQLVCDTCLRVDQ